MYENNVDDMVREAFLFTVTVYSKHFPFIKKNKRLPQFNAHKAENVLDMQTASKLSSNTFHPNKNTTNHWAELFEEKIKILQSTFFYQCSTQLLTRKPGR